MSDLRSWAKRWNDASLRQVIASRKPSLSPWPIVGMSTLGVLAGAIASYAVTQREEIRRFAGRAFDGRGEWLGESGGVESPTPISTASNRSNHRRKAAVEVT